MAYGITISQKFILYYVRCLEGSNALAQKAWSYLNDSMRTDLCVRFKAQVVASAAIFMAARSLKVQLFAKIMLAQSIYESLGASILQVCYLLVVY